MAALGPRDALTRRRRRRRLLLVATAVVLSVVVLPSGQRSVLGRVPDARPPRVPARARPGAFVPPAHDDWARPRVFDAVGQRRRGGGVRVFVFTQGSYAPRHGWELRALGCRVGNELVPAVHVHEAVVECVVEREVKEGEHVSAVVDRTPSAELLLGGQLAPPGLGVVYQEGDLRELPADVVVRETGKLEGRGGSSRRRELLELGSELTWTPSMMDPPARPEKVEGRYEVCMMTQEKSFVDDLGPWVDYHRRLGVDMVYIYDNNAPRDIAADYKGRDDVEVLFWPHVKSQLQAHAHALLYTRRRCEWLILTDVDEWVMFGDALNTRVLPVVETPLKKFLGKLRERGVHSAFLHEIIMGPSGHHYRPKAPMAEAYTYLDDPQPKVILGKSIVWTNATLPSSTVHHVEVLRGSLRHAPSRLSQLSGTNHPKLDEDEAYLVHFKRRSWEDYVAKGKGGRNSMMVRDWYHAEDYSVDEVPPSFLKALSGKPFLAFRTYWRRIMATPLPSQILAHTSRSMRCVAAVDNTGKFSVPQSLTSWQPVCRWSYRDDYSDSVDLVFAHESF